MNLDVVVKDINRISNNNGEFKCFKGHSNSPCSCALCNKSNPSCDILRIFDLVYSKIFATLEHYRAGEFSRIDDINFVENGNINNFVTLFNNRVANTVEGDITDIIILSLSALGLYTKEEELSEYLNEEIHPKLDLKDVLSELLQHLENLKNGSINMELVLQDIMESIKSIIWVCKNMGIRLLTHIRLALIYSVYS